MHSYAQRKVSGQVKSSDGLPVPFATITVSGTTIKTVSDSSGYFSISVPAGKTTLTVSAAGFSDAQVNATAPNVTVVMTTNVSTLNDVVVTGYTSQRKKEVTGAVSVVNVNNMKAVPAGNPDQMLQGQASGLNVISSGVPGGNSFIYIRGINSFGDASPLIIIDGVQGSLHDISPNDIESVQILKDGVASIYGVRGSNGVIVITTKKGKLGKVSLTYDGYYGTQQPLQGNVFNLLNPQEYADLVWKVSLNTTGTTPNSAQYGNGPQPVLPDYIAPAGAHEGDPSVDPALYNINFSSPIYQIIKANKSGTDWFHEVFKPAPIQSHTLSASGATDKANYFFSFNYFDQQGTLIKTYLKRYGVRANTSFNIKNHIRVGENLYIYYKQNPQPTGLFSDNGPISNTFQEQSIIPVYDIMGNFAGDAAKETGDNSANPVAIQIRSKDNKNYDIAIMGNLWGELELLKHVTARTSIGGNVDNDYYYYYNYHTYENFNNNSSNSFTEGSSFYGSWTWTNSLTYKSTFAEHHNVSIFGATEAISNYGRSVGGSRSNYFTDNPNYWTLNAGTAAGQTNFSYVFANQTLFSLIGKADYNYDQKYLLSFIIRRDKSSVFGPNKQTGVFPSASIGWRISQENFMKDISWLTELKIRCSYGVLGNQTNVPPYNSYTFFGSGAGNSYYDLNGTNNSAFLGFYATQLGSPNTGWEEDKITNVGLDAVLFKNALDFTVEYYKKKISGLLFPDQAGSTVGGGALPLVNIGDIQNSGVDINATYRWKMSRNWNFSVNANITTYKNRILNIPGTAGYFDAGVSRFGNFTRNQVGHPVSAFFGYQVVGLFRDSSDVNKSPAQSGAAPGRFKFADITEDKIIDANDRTFIGDPNPKFTYGVNLNVGYKNFDLTAVFYGSYDNDIVNMVKWYIDFYPSFTGNKSKDLLYNSWTSQNLNATIPIAENVTNFSTNGQPSSFYIENGSFLKCKSLIAGYTFSSRILSNAGFDKLKVYLQGINLFTITKYTGLDPELPGGSAAFGIDYGNYPNNQKSFIIGVNLMF